MGSKFSLYLQSLSDYWDCRIVTGEITTEKIDIERLKRPDPILFFTEVHLYEDELSDNGISSMSVKLVRL
jgi:hypothetical protein